MRGQYSAIKSKYFTGSIIPSVGLFRFLINSIGLKINNALLCLDDLLLGDISSLEMYVHRKSLNLMYKLLLYYITIYYAFIAPQPSSYSNIIYCVLVVYTIVKLVWILPKYSIDFLKIWGLIDLLLLFILNHSVNFYNLREHCINGFCLAIVFAFYSPSIIYNSTIALASALLDAVSTRAQSPSKNFFQVISACSAGYIFIICIAQISHIIVKDYVKLIMQVQEKTEDQIRAKTMFVASISHDLKNPLNSLLSFIELLKASSHLSKHDKSNLFTASYSGQILRYLIESILDMSKMEIGKFDIVRAPMKISKELRKIMKIEAALTQGKNIKLYKRQLTPLPHKVLGDPMRFAQAVINLIGNSVKFTTKGYIAIIIKWVKTRDEVKDFPSRDFLSQHCPVTCWTTSMKM